jgi:hypothetical protein
MVIGAKFRIQKTKKFFLLNQLFVNYQIFLSPGNLFRISLGLAGNRKVGFACVETLHATSLHFQSPGARYELVHPYQLAGLGVVSGATGSWGVNSLGKTGFIKSGLTPGTGAGIPSGLMGKLG